ncbi:MAG: glycoside-pentoside-hexuronide (GPH):cation symporter [Erysipelotrichaceae bacterium]
MSKNVSRRNKFAFGFGTIGRDMLYSLISMYLIFYLTDVLRLPSSTLFGITVVIVCARIFDALNDPIMGTIVDNTKSKWGKFKPWIFIGCALSGVFTILLFTDFGLSGGAYVALFAVLYVCWGLSFTANDISYWSMLPALTTDQKERERIGAFARICANIGLFAVVTLIVPITTALGDLSGSIADGYFWFAIGVVVILYLGQLVTLIGVKEPRNKFKEEEVTTLKGMIQAIFKNDQLLVVAVAMVLFMIGYTTTTSFGIYFFKYAYQDESMYSIFALVLGVSQLASLSFFPWFSNRFNRKELYSGATVLVVLGYIVFFFAPMNMLWIGLAGILLFVGQAFIQLLMLVFLTDTIEYGQWKSGKRNDSVTFSLQPFINKMGGAIATGIVGVTVILAGINDAATPQDVSAEGLFLMKIAMMVLPLIFIVAGYFIYRTKYIIDKEFYEEILVELQVRGDIMQ